MIYVYAVGPIDFWSGWLTPEEAIGPTDTAGAHEPSKIDQSDFEEFFGQAKEIARSTRGWEGDIRQGPFVAGFPVHDGGAFVVAWKQDNNGTTFIASPQRLLHLEG